MSPVLAKFDFGSLLVLAIFATPLIRAAIESARKSREAQQRPPRPKGERTAPTGGGAGRPSGGAPPGGKPLTWEDLMSGRGAQASAPKEPPPLPKATPVLAPEPEVEFEDDWHEHEGPMVPRTVLGRAPSEDELERHGGDRGRPLTELGSGGRAGRADGRPERRLVGGLESSLESGLESSLAGLGSGLSKGLPSDLSAGLSRDLSRRGPAGKKVHRAQGLSVAGRRAGTRARSWRSALVQAEMLAGPIALRDSRAPGPFGAPPGLGGR